MDNVADRIRSLPPDKLDALLKQLRPNVAASQPRVAPRRQFRPAEDENFNLVVKREGNLESLAFETRRRFTPDSDDPDAVLGPEDVEIEVRAAALNFRDVAVALGMYPTPPGMPRLPLGCDAAGVVTAVGRDVIRVKVGDEVACLPQTSTFARYTRARQLMAIRKPPQMTFEQAAGLPLAFVTAHYGLSVLGRLIAGERVLIHSAAGGVGLAAIQIARLHGAQIFATAGTEEKRDYLRAMGIPHVMDSRSLRFGQDVMEITGGEGIDVVLNSLSGDAIAEGIKVLRRYGRFIEIGKRDFVAGRTLDLEPFRRGLSFIALDAAGLTVRQQHDLNRAFDELSDHFRTGTLQPLPIRTFPISRIREMFREMTLGTHIGKFVVPMQLDQVMVEVA
jgi:NADPH:quinone reductase-like Zn-dependent oxidoreductase